MYRDEDVFFGHGRYFSTNIQKCAYICQMNGKIDVEALLKGPLADLTERIRVEAHNIHADVNQHYDGTFPYGVHLDAVTAAAMRFIDAVIADERDLAVVYFGTMNHDAIEDARQTYNDVLARARRHFGDDKSALMATEIVYALTNEKGRSRAERADDRYYSLIRTTPYAPLVKAADRLANFTYSCIHAAESSANSRMIEIYRAEMPHFLRSIVAPDATDIRLTVPQSMIEALTAGGSK